MWFYSKLAPTRASTHWYTVRLLLHLSRSEFAPFLTSPLAPSDFSQLFEYLWDYHSAPDPNLGGRNPELWQGRALGGGSAVNGMGYCRGAPSVFNEWALLSGNIGLSWESMFHAFKATTHFQEDVHPADQVPINQSSPFVDKLSSALDLTEIDFVSGYGIGVTEQVDSIRADNRTRSDAWNTFGWMAANRPNFEVRHNAWASKIGFTGKKADSVTYNDTLMDSFHTIRAQEIVVAAGAIGSPHLLMLSGVGPADQLKAVGIKVVQDSPQVGQNLLDHHYAQLVYETIPEMGTTWQLQHNDTAAQEAEAEYTANGDGLMGVPAGNVFAAFRVPDSVFDGLGSYHVSLPEDRPHILHAYSTSPFRTEFSNYSTITPFTALVQPEGAGNITIASADYRVMPVINSAYWATPADRAAIIYAYKEYRSLFTSPELSPYAPVELFPGAHVTSDDDIWDAIQRGSGSFHHPMGTVAIGSVLDSNWRVHGVSGLRVVGTPAAPNLATCHPQGTAYALGYRAAMDIAAADGVHIISQGSR
ncbi:Oxygen-dependent choline dehydrogenase [Daldinia childiae]|uniref:Oxygen-dependent choline dehydrogenase n=1 Tax=Daldinia childiae TaxID=326645 RepID=UPI00144624DE|nr:Oxygen-dependent choline dehydrogenase [Daldinia childiae]KAF3058489.1 Oxygen-dependent choline dehydrogenase [Daldinia childiae]